MVVEGVVDQFAAVSASIPIVKENEFFANATLLLGWLLPQATYYFGEIDQGESEQSERGEGQIEKLASPVFSILLFSFLLIFL